jgi:hypothetical protein
VSGAETFKLSSETGADPVAFPQTILPITVEILVNNVWTDITSDVYARDHIAINSRGKNNESRGQPDPVRMSLTLNNRLGKYSPRNPNGAYFGLIGKNTQIRASVRNGQVRGRFQGSDQFYTIDSAAVSIVGDIDIRTDVSLMTWRPSDQAFMGPLKGNAYMIWIETDGRLTLRWIQGGVSKSATSTIPIPGHTTGRKALRVTLDVNNGAAGNTATFYYSNNNTMSGTWVQFDQVIQAFIASIDDTGNNLGVYFDPTVTPAECFEAQVYNGIAGTLVANPVFTSQANGAISFSDGLGNTWLQSGSSSLDNRHYRFWGDVSAWPVKWDTSGRDVYVKLDCSGFTRRLGQGNAPTPSALRHSIPTIGSALVGYWPLEEQQGASLPEAVVGGTARGRFVGSPGIGSYSGFVASARAVQVKTGRVFLPVKPYTNTNYFQVRFLMRLNSTSIPTDSVMMRIKTNNSLGWIDFIYATGDIFYFKTYNQYGVLSMTGSNFDVTDQILGQDVRWSLEFKKNGTGVDCKQVILPVGENFGFLQSDTNASITLGSCTSVYINPDGVDFGDTNIGQVTVENVETSVFNLSLETVAYRGERSNTRIERLCSDNSLSLLMSGHDEDAEYLGFQTRIGLLQLLREAGDVDNGILFEAREKYAFRYRTRESLCNQDPIFTLAYTDESLAQFEPTDDDQYTRNKVTVSRTGGAAAVVEDTTSLMSTQAPPLGVGLYDDSLSLSVYSDDQASHQAGWRVNLGTVNEFRWPVISLNLAHPDYAGNSALTRQILSADVGDKLTVTSPPAWMPPESIGQLILGYSEVFSQFEHTIKFICAPATPYRTAIQNSHPSFESRYSNLNTTVNTLINTTSTSLSVAFSAGPRWTHADGDYDIMINGERMTVTAIAGTTSPQTFTVTRSVNGVVKSHSVGEKIYLFDPVVYGL